MPGLRIGVNALYLLPGGVGGTEIYLRNLLASWQQMDLDHQFILYTNQETGAGLAGDHPRFETRVQALSAANRPARLIWEQSRLPIAVSRDRIDVLFNPGFTSPLLTPARTVTVFHDLQHKRHPEYFRWFDLPFWRLFLHQSAHASTHLLADSQATKTDLHRYYRLPDQRVTVVPLGVGEEFFAIGQRRSGVSTSDPYFLCPSTSHPHKNLPRLVRAFTRFAQHHANWRLTITGVRGFAHADLEATIKDSSVRDRIEWTGWLPRNELLRRYEEASVLVYPSTFEGFGLPVLEGLASALPTICSRIPVLEEIGGDSVRYFDPSSDDDLVSALTEVAENPSLRERLASDGPAHASQFRWERCAKETLKVLVGT